MTQPQSDPATDVGAALARLAEQAVAFQRQIVHLEAQTGTNLDRLAAELKAEITSESKLTDAKFVTYRTLIDAQATQVALALEAVERANQVLSTSTERAITKESIATEKRFDSVNEFRQQQRDIIATFMPRTEALQLAEQATIRIRELGDVLPSLMPRSEAVALSDRNSERIQELTDRMNRTEGRGQGVKDNKAGFYVAIGLAVAIISVVVAVANILSRTGG